MFQGERNLTTYLLIQLMIHTPELYQQYVQNVKAIIERFHGEYIIRGGQITSFIGNWNPDRIVLIKFPLKSDIEEFFHSEEYKKIKHFREDATISSAIIIETPN